MPDVLFAPWRYEYLVSDKQGACIFCEAAASDDDDESLVVHRGKRVFVLLNRYPYTNGHVMVAPLAHEAWLSDSGAETLTELIATVARGAEDPRVGVPDRRPERRHQLRVGRGRRRRRSLPRPRRAALGGGHELHDRRRRRPRRARGPRRRRAAASAPLFAEARVSAPEPTAAAAARSPLAAMALAWLFPGLGHFYLGRRRTAIAFALIVTATFLAGLSLPGPPLHGRGGPAADDPRDLRRLRRRPAEHRGARPLGESRRDDPRRRPTSTAARTC